MRAAPNVILTLVLPTTAFLVGYWLRPAGLTGTERFAIFKECSQTGRDATRRNLIGRLPAERAADVVLLLVQSPRYGLPVKRHRLVIGR